MLVYPVSIVGLPHGPTFIAGLPCKPTANAHQAYVHCRFATGAFIQCRFTMQAYSQCRFAIEAYVQCRFSIEAYVQCRFATDAVIECRFALDAIIECRFALDAVIECRFALDAVIECRSVCPTHLTTARRRFLVCLRLSPLKVRVTKHGEWSFFRHRVIFARQMLFEGSPADVFLKVWQGIVDRRVTRKISVANPPITLRKQIVPPAWTCLTRGCAGAKEKSREKAKTMIFQLVAADWFVMEMPR